MKKPNFFIIGAPKCGTTSMAKWLSEHPQIYVSPVKEPHYFDLDQPRLYESERAYEKLFAKADKIHLAVGEASTGYLFSSSAVPRIMKYDPRAKLIVMLRNPVEMAPSLHEEMVFQMFEDVEDFQEAWALQAQRAAGDRIPSFCPSVRELAYGERCKIGNQVSRLLSVVPKNQCHFIFLDDLKIDTRTIYLEVLAFLGIKDDRRNNFPVENSSKTKRSKILTYIIRNLKKIRRNVPYFRTIKFGFGSMLNEINSFKKNRRYISAQTQKKLLDYFDSDIKLLEKELGRDLNEWRSVSKGGNIL